MNTTSLAPDQLRQRQQRALYRAVHEGIVSVTSPAGRNRWAIDRPGALYAVEKINGEYRCTCPAGQQALPCKHSASAFLVDAIERGQQQATSAHQTAVAAPAPAACTPAPAASHSPAGRGRLATDEPTSLAALLGWGIDNVEAT